MKKVIALVVATFLVFALAGCGGGGRPADMSDDVYTHGKSAVDYAESYLDGRMTADEAEAKLGTLYNMIGEAENSENESDGLVKAYVFSLETDIMLKNPDSDVRENIDKLKSALGE